MRPRLVALALLAAAACGKGATTAGPPAGRDAASGPANDASASVMDAAPEDPRAVELWARASEGDDDDLARLAGYVGSDGLIEGSVVPLRRLVALRALAFSEDFTPLPFLARAASSGSDDEALAALDAAARLAAEPRRAVDPEDAPEIREGTVALVVLTRDVTKPAVRRARAVSVLRMLASRGWAPASEVPTDLDAR